MNNLNSDSPVEVLPYKSDPEQGSVGHGDAVIELIKDRCHPVDMGSGPVTHIININTEHVQIIYASHKPELEDATARPSYALEQSCNVNFAQITNFDSTILLRPHVTKISITENTDACQRLPPDGGETFLTPSTLIINASNNTDAPDR